MTWLVAACLIATPLGLAAVLVALAWALGEPACGVCGAALSWWDGLAGACAPCRQRYALARYYGGLAAWDAAVGAAWCAGKRGRAFREAVDTMLVAGADEERRAA